MNGEIANAKTNLEDLMSSGSAKYAPLALLVYFDLCKGRWGRSGDMETGLYALLRNTTTQPVAALLRPFALRLLARDAAIAHDEGTANMYRMQVLADYPNTVHEPAVMYDRLVSYVQVENNIQKAQELLAKMVTLYPHESLTQMARAELGEKVDFSSLGKQQVPVSNQQPISFSLSRPYPNPFNPSTTIEFALPFAGDVVLSVYDILGKEVASLANGYHEPGYYSVAWDASAMAGGMYLARFTVVDKLGAVTFVRVRKLLLVK